MNFLTSYGQLPQLAVQMHPIVGCGLDESHLMMTGFKTCASAEEAMVKFREEHSPEQAPFRRCYWLTSTKDGRGVLRYVVAIEPRRVVRFVGITENDLDAARLLIGNSLAGVYIPYGIRWELYEDEELEEPIDMGRFDQWDLLKDVSDQKVDRDD